MSEPMTMVSGLSGGLRLRFASDERLAKLACLGDDRAFEQVFERYEPELYRYCRGILAHHEDAQDALQATMASALRALPGEARSIALKPWLYRVAHNESISILRRRPAWPVQHAEPELAPGADIEAESRERLRQLVADLDSLPQRQRGALTMRELSGMSYEQVGQALSLSPAAARQAVFEARTALAELGEGREMECEEARRAISARDGRVLRGRKLRAHIRSCDGCTGFEASIAQRRSDFQLLSPLLPGAAGAGLLAGLIGGEASRALAGPGLVKVIATVSAAAVVGTGAAQFGGAIDLPGLPGGKSDPATHRADPPTSVDRSGAAGATRVSPGAAVSAGSRDERAGPGREIEPGSHGKGEGGRGTGSSKAPVKASNPTPSAPTSGTAEADASSPGASSQSGSHVSNAGGAGDQTAAGSDPDLPATSNGKPPAGSNAGGSGSPVAGANSNAGGNSAHGSQASSPPGQTHSQAAEHSNSSAHGGSG